MWGDIYRKEKGLYRCKVVVNISSWQFLHRFLNSSLTSAVIFYLHCFLQLLYHLLFIEYSCFSLPLDIHGSVLLKRLIRELGFGKLLLELELSWANWKFGLSSVVGSPRWQLSTSCLLWLDHLQLRIYVMLLLLTIRFLVVSPSTFSWILSLCLSFSNASCFSN